MLTHNKEAEQHVEALLPSLLPPYCSPLFLLSQILMYIYSKTVKSLKQIFKITKEGEEKDI